MAKKRKTLPKEIRALLEEGNIDGLKEQFSHCEPNALAERYYGRNVFFLSPLPREFAFWAKEQGADVNFKDCYGQTPIFRHASVWNGDVPLLLELLKYGGEITDYARELLRKSAENFQRMKRGIQEQVYLDSQTENISVLEIH